MQFRLFDNYEKSDSCNKNKILYKRNTEGSKSYKWQVDSKNIKIYWKM